jgi:hypothetical protein
MSNSSEINDKKFIECVDFESNLLDIPIFNKKLEKSIFDERYDEYKPKYNGHPLIFCIELQKRHFHCCGNDCEFVPSDDLINIFDRIDKKVKKHVASNKFKMVETECVIKNKNCFGWSKTTTENVLTKLPYRFTNILYNKDILINIQTTEMYHIDDMIKGIVVQLFIRLESIVTELIDGYDFIVTYTEYKIDKIIIK